MVEIFQFPKGGKRSMISEETADLFKEETGREYDTSKDAIENIVNVMEDAYFNFISKVCAFVSTCESLRDVLGAKTRSGAPFDRDEYLKQMYVLLEEGIRKGLATTDRKKPAVDARLRAAVERARAEDAKKGGSDDEKTS